MNDNYPPGYTSWDMDNDEPLVIEDDFDEDDDSIYEEDEALSK